MKTTPAKESGSRLPVGRAVRRQSEHELFGLPLWALALGPDPVRGEKRGHARGVLAVGDMATGIVAVGGIARGFVAVGGLAFGVFACGGLAIGVLLAFGGAALGLFAFGGAACGMAAMGGLAVGEFVVGGQAMGEHVISPGYVDPFAVRFFQQFGIHPVPPR